MRIEYELTEDDWVALGEHCGRTAPGFRQASRMGAISGVIAFLVVSILGYQRSASAVWLVVAAVLAGGWVWSGKRSAASLTQELAARLRREVERHR